MSKNGIKLEDKQIEAIKNYLQVRLGVYGIDGYKLKIKETPELIYDYSISQVISKDALGIFGHALKECLFFGKIWSLEKTKDEIGHRHLLQCALQYDHFGGGSNGCDMDIKCHVNSDGVIIESYEK